MTTNVKKTIGRCAMGKYERLYRQLAEKAVEHAASRGLSDEWAWGFLNAMWPTLQGELRAWEPGAFDAYEPASTEGDDVFLLLGDERLHLDGEAGVLERVKAWLAGACGPCRAKGWLHSGDTPCVGEQRT